MEFLGYERENGQVGVRNYLAIIPTVGCVNELASKISEKVEDAKVLLHHQGCTHLPYGLEFVTRTLTGFGENPNVAAVLLVSLGCEGVQSEMLAKEIAKSKKPVERVTLYEEGGFTKTLKKGLTIAREMASYVSEFKRESFDLNRLRIGIKCGSSDATSGIVSNPAVGRAMDFVMGGGGTVIFGETAEIIGAEHILVKKVKNKEVAERLLSITKAVEEEVEGFGANFRGSNPTPGNIRGGITTIEEKSLGAIAKGGIGTIQDVLNYGEAPRGHGLYVMDTPGREMECLSGLVAAGSQIIVFSTGLGAPQGFPITPVIKVSGNPKTCERLREHIDVDVSRVLDGRMSHDEAGEKIFKFLVKVASGKRTKAEKLGYDKFIDIYAPGPLL